MNSNDLDSSEKIEQSPATFVIPFYGDQERSLEYLDKTIGGVFAQEDPNWQIVLVDDASSKPSVQNYLRNLTQQSPKITVLWQKTNRGQGICRNRAIEWAWQRGSSIILFNDADDISSPQRLKVVRETFLQYPNVDLIYSSFIVIDENDRPIPRSQIAEDILEIIDANTTDPVEGQNAWIKIGTVTGFSCLPSSTALRTSIAYRCPFPDERVSEDSYVWMLIAAQCNEFKYLDCIPSLYRIPSDKKTSTHRERIGPTFYREKARVDTNGFFQAIAIALERKTITPGQVDGLKAQFFRRVAETLQKEHELELAQIYMQRAASFEAK